MKAINRIVLYYFVSLVFTMLFLLLWNGHSKINNKPAAFVSINNTEENEVPARPAIPSERPPFMLKEDFSKLALQEQKTQPMPPVIRPENKSEHLVKLEYK